MKTTTKTGRTMVDATVHMFDDGGNEWVKLTCLDNGEGVKLNNSARESKALTQEAALLVMNGLAAAKWNRTTTSQKVPGWAL